MRNSRQIIDIRAAVENIHKNLNLCESPKESLLSALVGFHSFTGCDTVSAFAGRGKIKPLMLMMKSKDYVVMFASFGNGIEIDDSLINCLNRFVCHLFDWKGKDSFNNIRYRMYCKSRAKIACKKLLPCEDVLQLHILKANYQAFIWRQSLLAQQAENDPLQNGWCLDEEGCFGIKWMTCNPAPDEVTDFILKLSAKNNYFENGNSASID